MPLKRAQKARNGILRIHRRKQTMDDQNNFESDFWPALAVVLVLMPVRSVPVFGQHDSERAQGLRLQGTWNVTLTFPVCNTLCPCPGGVPNIPHPQLNTLICAHDSDCRYSGY
jgi:hypothetical protein